MFHTRDLAAVAASDVLYWIHIAMVTNDEV
jgi:hypothetical protein